MAFTAFPPEPPDPPAFSGAFAIGIPGGRPGSPVDVWLDDDRDYRRPAAADELPKIAPTRFNATGDRVVACFHKDDRPEGQRTVVTRTRHRRAGRRVVREEAEARMISIPVKA